MSVGASGDCTVDSAVGRKQATGVATRDGGKIGKIGKTDDPLAQFHPATQRWFLRSFSAPTRAQSLGWKSIVAGDSTLVLAPTGSGKTLAAFLAAIDRLAHEPLPEKKKRCRVLYVSPLKALAVDVERNLRAPIAGVAAVATAEGLTVHVPEVDVRTGDTPQKERARMLRAPGDILITTPESLYLLLTGRAREILASIDTVIIDEIHSMVPTKRGVHLFLSLERLEALRAERGFSPLQRIGLSATQRPLDEVARLLGGHDGKSPRPVSIVDAGEKKTFDLRVEVPVDDMSRLGDVLDGHEQTLDPLAPPARRSIWPAIHPRLLELIRAHRSTIVFVNSRRLAERLAGSLNELANAGAEPESPPVEIALAHHGSIAKEKRLAIEDRLKRGELPAIVATSSLELGIDMGAVDLVIQIEAPPSIASAMQRIGRASHQVGAISRGVVFPKYRADLLACAAAVEQMIAGKVEETFYPRNALDVLAQQMVAICASQEGVIELDALFALVRRAAPYVELSRGAFEGVLDMLTGRYPSDAFAELKPRLVWDRLAGTLRARDGAARLAILNGGTIADRGLYGVFLVDRAYGKGETSKRKNPRVGELDEEMVFESRVGDVFLLGASSWRIEEITQDKVMVSPAPGEPGKMPFWHGDRPGRPVAFGEAIGALSRALVEMPDADATKRLHEKHALDTRAAQNLVAYLRDQREATGVVPSDRTIVVERFVDEVGDHRICILSPFGSRVHAPWATAVSARLTAQGVGEVDVVWSDDGMVFRLPESDTPPETARFLGDPKEIEDEVVRALSGTSLFAARFREAAARALLLPKKHPTKRQPLWAQRKRAGDLLAVASQHGSFPILLETYREVLRDVFDLPSLVALFEKIEQRRVRVVTVDTRVPSPFAASLLFAYAGNFMYDGDAPIAERRAQILGLDHARLRELLGEAELRELLDPDALESCERGLQRLDGRRPARSADEVHDLLLSLSDLSEAEIAARSSDSSAAPAHVRQLVEARRVVIANIGASPRAFAAEEAARYRDALGIVPPSGLPNAFLERTREPLHDLLGRFARTHGPFVVDDVIARYPLAPAVAARILDDLVARERVVTGAFLRAPRPGAGVEYCDAEVLRTIRRLSLARSRREAEPVEPAAYARFLVEWHELARVTPGRVHGRASLDQLLGTIERLEGAPIPASVLETDVLPARVPGYSPSDLDALLASGDVVWAGIEPLGENDGRIALYLAEHEPLLARSTRPEALDDSTSVLARVHALLTKRGALFFADLAREIGGFPGEIVDGLWELVFAGLVTNDTLAPLRSYLRAGGRERGERRESPRRRNDSMGALLRARRAAGPPGSEGRWSLRSSRWGDALPSDTERRAALARTLLERYGVLVREAAAAEGAPGGFAAVYDVLKAMEEAGRIRRGYFVAGRGATQFALPPAVERLRALREAPRDDDPRVRRDVLLAATDPANPYGAALPWPTSTRTDAESTGARPTRSAGAMVILHDGELVAHLGRSEQTLLTFLPTEEPMRAEALRAISRTLSTLVDDGRRKALLLGNIDGEPAARSSLAPALAEAGFIPGLHGLQRRGGRVPD